MSLRWLDRFPSLQVWVRLQGPTCTLLINTDTNQDLLPPFGILMIRGNYIMIWLMRWQNEKVTLTYLLDDQTSETMADKYN